MVYKLIEVRIEHIRDVNLQTKELRCTNGVLILSLE